MDKIINIIGLGNAGVNLYTSLSKTINPAKIKFILLETNKDKLNAVTDKDNLTKILVGNGLGTGGSPELAKELLNKQKVEIIENLKGELNLVCAGLGGGTGEGFLNTIVDWSKELGVLTLPIMLTKDGHFNSLKEIKTKNVPYIEYNQDTVYSANPDLENLPPDEYLQVPFTGYRQTIQAILNFINKIGTIAIDINDIKSTFSKEGKAISICEYADTLDKVFRKIEANPFFENNFKDKAKGFLFFLEYPERSLTQKQLNEIKDNFGGSLNSKVSSLQTQSKYFTLNVIMTGLSEAIDKQYFTAKSYQNMSMSVIRQTAKSYHAG
jgi:cell division GTPase FtsZ